MKVDKYTERAGVTYFNILLSFNEFNWNIEKRFREFEALEKVLLSKYPKMIPLGGKSMFTLKKPEEIESRRKEIENYLKFICSNKQLLNIGDVRNFLEIDIHNSNFSYEDPKALSVIKQEFELGIYSFLHIPTENLLITVENDMATSSRASGFFSNIFSSSIKQYSFVKLWEPQIEDYKIDSLKKIMHFSYNHRVSHINFCTQEKWILVGYFNGEILLYKLDKNNIPSLQLKIKAHAEKVLACAKLPKHHFIISCGKDCNTGLFSTVKGELLSQITDTNSNSIIYIDEPRMKIYLGSNSGNIHVYDISNIPLQKLNTIMTKLVSPLKEMIIDFPNNLIVAGTKNGNLSVIEFEDQNQIKGKVMGDTFDTKERIKSMVWRPHYKEIVIGTTSGSILFVHVIPYHEFLKFQPFQGAIKRMVFLDKENIMLATSMDNSMICFQLRDNYDHYIRLNHSFSKIDKENKIIVASQNEGTLPNLSEIKDKSKNLEGEEEKISHANADIVPPNINSSNFKEVKENPLAHDGQNDLDDWNK